MYITGLNNLFAEGDTVQLGAYGYHAWSYAGKDARNNTNKTFMAPIVTYHFASLFGQDGWYLRTTDELWSFDWESDDDTASIPLGLMLGKVFSVGSQQLNVFFGGDYYVKHRGTDPEWDIKLNVTLLFPE